VPVCADTGNGATLDISAAVLANGTTADTAVQAFFDNLKVKRIEFPEEALERIECSDLSTTEYRSYIPSDLTDPPQLVVTANFDTMYSTPFVGQVLGTVTVTFPLRPGEATAANYAGTAYVGAITRPTLANGELQEITLRIDFDGVTGPTFTKAVATT
jgi:hypothetical protein